MIRNIDGEGHGCKVKMMREEFFNTICYEEKKNKKGLLNDWN